MSANEWLIEQLAKNKRVDVREDDGELVCANKGTRSYRVYCPDERYMITIDNVQHAIEIGANVVAFASWVEPSQEAVEYGKKHDVTVCHFSDFLRMLSKR